MTRWWMVRAGDDNELVPVWKEQEVVSIGWPHLGNPYSYKNREELIYKATKIYSEEKPATCRAWANQVWRFSNDVKKGDRVLTYSKDKREYLIGTVTSSFEFNKVIVSQDYPNVLHVKWEEKLIPRDLLSQGAKNSLGSTLTVFRVDDWGSEVMKLLAGDIPIVDDADNEEEIIKEDLVQKGLTMIQDKVDSLDPWQMQDLVAGLLQAMGYTVKVSKKGPDGGVDILAHRDAFGFEKPIIKVQVKHRKSSSSAPEIQQLLGAHPIGESGLFVSTGGFTYQAEAIAKQHNVKLLDLEELVTMIVHWYEKIPIEARSLLPLQKMYVPE